MSNASPRGADGLHASAHHGAMPNASPRGADGLRASAHPGALSNASPRGADGLRASAHHGALSNASPRGADGLHASAHHGALSNASPRGGSLRASPCDTAEDALGSALDLDAGDEALLWKEDCLWNQRQSEAIRGNQRQSEAITDLLWKEDCLWNEALLSGRMTLASAVSNAEEEAPSRALEWSITSEVYQASDSKVTSYYTLA